MAYTTIDKPSDYFNTKLYTGNGSTQSITGVGFQPDWLWVKRRNNANNHQVFDVIRGTNVLVPNETGAESNYSAYFTSLDSDGFTLASSSANLNASGGTYASWNWLAGGTASSNTDGSITSSVSANTTAGFSIVSYTGTGANATVGHGLGVAPKMVIVKCTSQSDGWFIYNENIGAGNYIRLDQTIASSSASTLWNSTDSTSSVFSVGTNGGSNGSSRTYIAYCFAEKKGFSKFGSYTGNGSTDGAFIYTGFKPAFLIIKVTNESGFTWVMYDNKRDTFNTVGQLLQPSESSAELDNSNIIDFLSNGIKMRNDSLGTNGSADTYIYMAFAENPFVTSTGIPTTAR